MSFGRFISTYANPLSTFAAARIGSATVIWQTNKGNGGVKKELKADIDKAKKELNSKITTGFQHVQAIALGSAYATMKCLSRDKKMMNKWMGDITKCIGCGCTEYHSLHD